MEELNKLSGTGRSGSLVKASGALAVVVMLIAAAAMPAVACDCGAKDEVGGTDVADNFIIEDEHGFGKLKTLVGVAADKDAISVIKDLHSKGYQLQYGRANIQRIRPKENESQEALLVIIPAESKNSHNSAQLIFASNGEMTCVASAIIEDGENYRKIEVYEIDNGAEKNYVVENRAGTISIDGKTIITGSQIRSGIDCDICHTVCNYITTAGCGLSGYLVCTAACAGFAGPTCPAICAVVWAVFCLYGSNQNCDTCCQSYC